MRIASAAGRPRGNFVCPKRGDRGFSLVEVLVVVFVLVLMSAIALPVLVQLADEGSTEDAKDARKGQMLSSISAAAQVAGLDFLVPGNPPATKGGSVPGVPVAEGQFALPRVPAEDRIGASPSLWVEDGMLVFRGAE